MSSLSGHSAREIARYAAALGYTVAQTRGGHLCWRHESGTVVYSSSTPSDWRAQRKIKADLRRMARGKEA